MSKAKDKKVKGVPEGFVTVKIGDWEHEAEPATVSVDGILLSDLLYEYRRAQRRTGVIS
jgi:hypothetical protein